MSNSTGPSRVLPAGRMAVWWLILKSPTDRTVELPEANFISAHLIKILEQAHEGKAFSQVNVFDGGDDADKILKTTNIIGKPEVVARCS